MAVAKFRYKDKIKYHPPDGKIINDKFKSTTGTRIEKTANTTKAKPISKNKQIINKSFNNILSSNKNKREINKHQPYDRKHNIEKKLILNSLINTL